MLKLCHTSPINGERTLFPSEKTHEFFTEFPVPPPDIEQTSIVIKNMTGYDLQEYIVPNNKIDWDKLLNTINIIRYKLTNYKEVCGGYHEYIPVKNTDKTYSAISAAENFYLTRTLFNDENIVTPYGVTIVDKNSSVVGFVAGYDQNEPCVYIVCKTDMNPHLLKLYTLQRICECVINTKQKENYSFLNLSDSE